MQVGMIGLGRMGSNMVRRLLKAGHECIVYNRSPEPVHALVGEGASGAASLTEFVRMLHQPRHLVDGSGRRR
jgi:6-phosphogluconate dehydrogenase